MLIGSDGEKLGLLAIEAALEEAQKKNLDLVQVSPSDAQPVVCKLLDFGKFQFEKKKSTGGTKKPKKQSLKKIKSFINDGDKTKISVRFRGREILNSNLGLELLNRLREDLQDIAQVDQEPSLEGRQLLMVLSQIRKK